MFTNLAPFLSTSLTDKQINSLDLIKSILVSVSKCDPDFIEHINHSDEHSDSIVQRIDIFAKYNNLNLTPVEIYLLFAAAYLHDIGLYVSLYDPDLFKNFSKDDIRVNHPSISATFILDKAYQKLVNLDLNLQDTHATYISEICGVHNDFDKLSKLDSVINLEGYQVRLQLVAALLMIGDQLHVGRSRVNLENLIRKALPFRKRFFWYGYSCIEEIEIEEQKIRLVFGHSKEIDEIDFEKQVASPLSKEIGSRFDQYNSILVSYGFSPVSIEYTFRISIFPDDNETMTFLSTVVTEKSLRDRNENRKKTIYQSIKNKGAIYKKTINNELVILRRWSSYTPRMPKRNTISNLSIPDEESSLGGGYFLIWNQTGLVIDPGYDFLRNLWNLEIPEKHYFELDDISAVIISHAHDDHSHDIEPIISLIYKKRKLTKKSINLPILISEGTHIKYERIISINDFLSVSDLIPDDENPVSENTVLAKKGIKIQFQRSHHNEIPWLRNNSGVSLKFFLSDQITVGYTSDTRFFDGLIHFFSDVDILLIHFGNVGPPSPDYDKNHLGLNGCHDLITGLLDMKPRLFLLGEFGEEEVGEDRIKLCEHLTKLTNLKKHNKVILPMDIGLRIKLPRLDVFCNEHNRFEPFNQIVPHLFPTDEGIKYSCS